MRGIELIELAHTQLCKQPSRKGLDADRVFYSLVTLSWITTGNLRAHVFLLLSIYS